MRPVDLRSDTVTRPTPGMRAAMLAAEVGDDVLGDDPTVRALEARCAALSGKEASLFVPSGTMANQLAVVVHTRPGDAVLVADNAHVLHHEGGGAAANAGAELRVVPSDRGRMTPEAVVAAVPSPDVHHPVAALLCVEDTNNAGGGVVHALDRLDALCATARAHGMRAHLDGARLFNAVVASGVPLERRARGFDTVAFCFSKGLGAPVGSILCGDAASIHRARRARKRMGGGMRQAGFLAAAALYALDHHVARLAEDHARARQLGVGLMVEGYEVQLPETNLVYVQVPDARRAQDFLAARGVLAFAVGPDRMRLCTHLDVDDAGVERAIAALAAWRREVGGPHGEPQR